MNDNIKNILISGVALLVIVLIVGFAMKPGEGARGPAGPPGEPASGALAGPDIPSDWLRWGSGEGVRFYPHGQPFSSGTTTVCRKQVPGATSTLAFADVRVDLATTTSAATSFTISKNTATTSAPSASTSPIYTYDFTSNLKGTITYVSTTTAALDSINVFGPNEWALVTMKGAESSGDDTPAGLAPIGFCNLLFRVI